MTLRTEVFTSPTREIPGGTFSPVTSTLVHGDREAVLVDAQFVEDDVDALGDLVESTGRTLTTIFLTHGHGDHWFGCGRLTARFPSARTVATPGVVAYVDQHLDRELRTAQALFGDRVVVPTSRPAALDEGVLRLEGHDLPVLEVEQGDIAPAAVLHVPSLATVVAGDVAYNRIHQMLALSGPEQWDRWVASVDAVARLEPRYVIAGHKEPGAGDDAAEVLHGTRSYIQDFAAAVAVAPSVDAVVETMRATYPDHGNLTTLVFSAQAAMRRRPAPAAADRPR